MRPKVVSDFFSVLCKKDPFQEKHINNIRRD